MHKGEAVLPFLSVLLEDVAKLECDIGRWVLRKETSTNVDTKSAGLVCVRISSDKAKRP